MSYTPPPAAIKLGSKAWAYYRDSGGNKQEASIDQQRKAIREYCESYGLILVREFADVAKSGKSLHGREEFARMREMVKEKSLRPDLILVWDYARFSRNARDSRREFSYFEDYCIIHPLNEIVTEGKVNFILREFRFGAAEDESERKSIDAKRGMADAVTRGFSGGGLPPLGYKREQVIKSYFRDGMPRYTSKWVLDGELAPLVRRAFELRSEGRSYREISDSLAGRLYKSLVSWQSFFKNKTYIGVGKCGTVEVPGHHEAIISEELFEKVQKINQERGKIGGGLYHPRRVGNPSLLTGLAYCIHCGSAMSKEKNGRNKWGYYICGRKKRERSSSCVGRMVNQKKLDGIVIGLVLNQVLTPAYFESLLGECQARLNKAEYYEEESREIIEGITGIERKITNLRRAVEDGTERAVDWLKERESELARLELRLAEVERRRAAASLKVTPEALRAVLEYWRGQLAGIQTSGDVRSLKVMLGRFVERIEVGYNKIVVRYTYPISDLEGIGMNWLGGTGTY